MALPASVGSVQMLNCARGQATTISALQEFARKTENIVCLLQEPWVDRHGNPPSLPNFDLFTPVPMQPKCATYVRRIKGLTATTTFASDASFLGTTITSTYQTTTTTFTLFNLYSPGRPEPLASILDDIQLPKNCILIGDFNAHHMWWQGSLPLSARTSTATHSIVNWLENNNFHLHNKPGIPTHHPRNGGNPSTIDLCFSRGSITQSILALAIDHDTTSDHSSITLSLSLPSSPPPTSPPRRIWHKADWSAFALHIQSANMDLTNLSGKEDTLRAISNITGLIHRATDIAVPLREPGKQDAPWWNHSLTLAKRAVKQADRRTRQNPTDSNRNDAQHKRSQWSTMVRRAKTTYRIKQLMSTSTTTVWRTIRHHNAHQKSIPPLEGHTDFNGKCKSLRDALFPAVNNRPRLPLPDNFLTSKRDMQQHTRTVTLHEVQLAISHLKYGTAVGPDGISYTTLRHTHEAAPKLLPLLFDACLRYAVHPPEWKTANCVIVPKPGKTTYSHPKSYRPISLQSCFGKLLEAIVAKRLTHTAILCGATHPSQMGGQPNNSAVDALLRTITPIATAISTRVKSTSAMNTAQRPAVLTHDIEGAFNKVHPTTLQQVMFQRRMPTYLTRWIEAFNTDRQISFGFDQQTEVPQPYCCGLPQGSPVSPVLFLIFSNAMLEKPHSPADAVDTSYIDDVCMVQTSRTIARANTLLEDRTEQHLLRGSYLGLTFSPSKTELLYCLPANSKNKNVSLSSHPPLRVMNTTLLPQRHIKYLGIHIDESLTFLHHAAMAAARGSQVLGSFSFLRHRSRGIPAQVAHHLAFTAVFPAMFWASPAWWTGSPSTTNTLKTTYNAVARWITGLPLNTRITNLITLAHLPPMEAYLDYLSLRFAIRLHFLPVCHATGPPRHCPGTRSDLPGLHHLYNLSKHLVMGKLEDRTTHLTSDGVQSIPSPNPDKITTPRRLHEQWLHTLPTHTIIIYTDGSQLGDGGTGCGWAIFRKNPELLQLSEGRCHLGKRAAVFDAELHAVHEATSSLLTTVLRRVEVYICIDNKAAIDTLSFNKSNHEYARRTLANIEQLRLLGWTIRSVWCPSHCDIPGNDRADTLAKQGAAGHTPCQYATTTKTWLLNQARSQLLRRWKAELPLAVPSFKFPEHLQDTEWKETRAVWRVFSNRSPSDPHPNQTGDPCLCGKDTRSSHHLLRDCTLLATHRTKLLASSVGDIQNSDFITNPKNFLPLRQFLRATGLGYTTLLCFDQTHSTNDNLSATSESNRSSSPEPDFGAFEI
jgi:ribonuclease HI